MRGLSSWVRRGGARLLEAARPAVWFLLAGLSCGGAAACEDLSYREIGREIRVLTTREDALVAPATARLTRFGRAALPQIETALHTASARGRRQLVAALAAIGDAEAIPILRHFAVYDTDDATRAACEASLRQWSTGPDTSRAQRAAAALTRISEKRARGEAPIALP